MKLITINLPDSYIRAIEKMSLNTEVSRAELIRQAIRSFLIREMSFFKKLEKETKADKITRFFDYCINCGKKLHRIEGGNHHFYKNIEVFQLKFCCSCYEQFKDKKFENFPKNLIESIYKKLSAYKKYRLRNSMDADFDY